MAEAVDEVRQPHKALAALVPLLGVGPPARGPRALQPRQRVRVRAPRRLRRRMGTVVALELLHHKRAWHLAEGRTGLGRSIANFQPGSLVPRSSTLPASLHAGHWHDHSWRMTHTRCLQCSTPHVPVLHCQAHAHHGRTWRALLLQTQKEVTLTMHA